MKGKRVLRKIGLDTHGLPIEVNVEKKLGFSGKGDIEAFGVENFCRECNNETATNIDEVNKVTDMMGQLIDTKNPYVTCENDFIESEWWILSEMHKKGLVYHGSKVLPYCPRCGTELASHEVSQGYQEDAVNTVIVPFKLVDKDEYLLVWTTTPWTLMDNVAACVNPEYEYLKVESMGYKFIIGKTLANKVLGDEYEILEEYKGSDLEYTEYEQLLKNSSSSLTIETVSIEEAADYACDDAFATLLLTKYWQENLDEKELDILYDMEVPLCLVLAKMEENGTRIEIEYLSTIEQQINEMILTKFLQVILIANKCKISTKHHNEVLYILHNRILHNSLIHISRITYP